MGGKENVSGEDVREGDTGLHGRGNEHPGDGAGVWAAPGHGEEDADVLGVIRV